MTVLDDALSTFADTKICARCKEGKTPDSFSQDRRYRDGRQSYCRSCMREYRRENRERINANRRRNPAADRERWLKTRYGIDQRTYEEMLAAQDGQCAICRATSDVPLAVDHDHRTGEVRGLLCIGCNFGLGQFGDSPANLMAALAYIGVSA